MKKTWMPTVAGVLNIVVGVGGLVVALASSVVFLVVGDIMGIGGFAPWLPYHITAMFSLFWIGLFVCSALAIAGGICALQRKAWGLALAGSIIVIFSVWFIGVAAVTLIALSKNEFYPGRNTGVINAESHS